MGRYRDILTVNNKADPIAVSFYIILGGISMSIFKGAGVAIVTPFHEDGSVNYEKFAELIEFQIQNGTDAIIVCGTTGESSTLTHEEHLDVIKFCAQKVNKRVLRATLTQHQPQHFQMAQNYLSGYP